MSEHFDLIIIGSGPAGLSSALYASRGKLKTLVLEKGQSGGQAAITHLIENYPGSIENSTGPNLTQRMVEQCKNFGAEIRKEEVIEVDFSGKEKVVKCKDKVNWNYLQAFYSVKNKSEEAIKLFLELVKNPNSDIETKFFKELKTAV